jgi:hypothetical protein
VCTVKAVDEIEFRLERWRRTTAAGAVFTGIALGLREALESEKERPAMVQPAPEGKPGEEPFELHLDPEHPEYTVAVVRPWLFR